MIKPRLSRIMHNERINTLQESDFYDPSCRYRILEEIMRNVPLCFLSPTPSQLSSSKSQSNFESKDLPVLKTEEDFLFVCFSLQLLRSIDIRILRGECIQPKTLGFWNKWIDFLKLSGLRKKGGDELNESSEFFSSFESYSSFIFDLVEELEPIKKSLDDSSVFPDQYIETILSTKRKKKMRRKEEEFDDVDQNERIEELREKYGLVKKQINRVRFRVLRYKSYLKKESPLHQNYEWPEDEEIIGEDDISDWTMSETQSVMMEMKGRESVIYFEKMKQLKKGLQKLEFYVDNFNTTFEKRIGVVLRRKVRGGLRKKQRDVETHEKLISFIPSNELAEKCKVLTQSLDEMEKIKNLFQDIREKYEEITGTEKM